jgi:hypothetical protein
MDPDDNIIRYLEWNRRQTANLEKYGRKIEISGAVTPVLDLPNLDNVDRYEHFFRTAALAGYRKFNLGLTPIWNKAFTLPIKELRKIAFVSAHGTSVKREIATGEPYKSFLDKDLAVLEILDPDKKWLINYDLFAGHCAELQFETSFSQTRESSAKLLARKLSLASNKSNATFMIMRRIVNDVAEIYRGTGRSVCFEIPGTKGWSLFPGIGTDELDTLIRLIQSALPGATLCIDVGHVLTWSKNASRLARLEEILARHAAMISMVHISSAGSNQQHFINKYKEIFGNKYPGWHIRSLDLSLAVFEEEMLHLIESLRRHAPRPLIEVSETRLPSVAIHDYFKEYNPAIIDDSQYYPELIRQGKLLGYANF